MSRLLLISLLSLNIHAAFYTFSASAESLDSSFIKVLGSGLENRDTKEILLMRCVGALTPEQTHGCERLQPLLSKIDGTLTPLKATYSKIEKLFYDKRKLEVFYFIMSDRTPNYNPEIDEKDSKISRADWENVYELKSRDRADWQFISKKIDSKEFKNLMRTLTVHDELFKTTDGCNFANVKNADEKSEIKYYGRLVGSYLSELPSIRAQTLKPHLHNSEYLAILLERLASETQDSHGIASMARAFTHKLQDSEGLAFMLREYYDYKPNQIPDFEVSYKFSRDLNLGFYDPSSMYGHCLELHFKTKSGREISTSPYCKLSKNYSWKKFVKSLPSCEELKN